MENAQALRRDLRIQEIRIQSEFDKRRSIPKNDSLVTKDRRSADDRLKEAFLKEWYATLETMRGIGQRVSGSEYRPAWVRSDVPQGVQADQFLHAYYYNVVREGHHYRYLEFYERNKNNPEGALKEALKWWKSLSSAPTEEDITIYQWSPYLRNHLSKERVTGLSQEEFREVCKRIFAMRDHSLRVTNETYGLPRGTPPKEREECIELLASYLWKQRTDSGKNVLEVIYHVLYAGAQAEVPLRLWEATNTSKWQLHHVGISSLGETVGWAMPNAFPPRNGRSSKALRALGYNVTIHSE